MFKMSQVVLILTLFINLAGCSFFAEKQLSSTETRTPDKEDNINSDSLTEQQQLLQRIEQLELSVQDWQELEPSVQRLVAIEAELKVLIKQLNSLVIEAEKDQQIANAKGPKTVRAPAKKAQPDTHAGGRDYALQLASIAHPGKVEQSWLDILHNSAGQLGGEQPQIQAVQIKNKTYYRIKIGKFSSMQAAKTKCNQLKGNNVDCIVSSYSKQALGDFLLKNSVL